MSDIYKEAILDAKKLREVAEQEAKNKIMEKITPYIKQMIKADQLNKSVITEQEEMGLDTALDTAGEAPQEIPQEEDVSLDDEPVEAPIDTSLDDDIGEVDASLPDEEGLITVDFNDLFQAAQDTNSSVDLGVSVNVDPQSGEASAELTDVDTGETEDFSVEDGVGDDLDLELESTVPSYGSFKNKLNEAYSAVDHVFYKRSVPKIVKESIRTKLFGLLEQLDKMVEKGTITQRQAKLNEKRLEFLYLKLEESGKIHTYSKISEDSTNMKLKKLAAKLFEESENLAHDSVSTGDTGVPVDDEYSEHAAEESGMSTELDDFLREFSSDEISGDTEEETPWEDGDAVIDEDEQADHATESMNENSADANTNANEDVAEGAAGFGDSDEDPTVEFEVEGLDISEAKKKKLRKESIRKKLARLKEASASKEDSWEDADPEGGADPTHSNLNEENEMDYTEEETFEIGDESVGEGGEAELTIKLDLPDEVEELLSSYGAGEVSAEIELETETEIEGDDEFGVGDDEEAVVLVDDEVGVMESRRRKNRKLRGIREARAKAIRARKLKEGKRGKVADLKRQLKRGKIAESLLRKANSELKRQLKENQVLKRNLHESNLFTAKTVYLNKFLMREGLSKNVLKQIVDHLDKAKTVTEAKAISTKINTRLNEAASKKLVGSSSRAVKPGSTKLKESASAKRPTNTANGDFNVDRWQVIAGIKNK